MGRCGIAGVAMLAILLATPPASSAAWSTARGDVFRTAVQAEPGKASIGSYGLLRTVTLADRGQQELLPGILVVDLDGDGSSEILLRTTQALVALRADGSLLWTRIFPVTEVGFEIAADLTGDGRPEIAFLTFNPTSIYVLDGAAGATLVELALGEHLPPAMPLLVDVDGDGRNDVVFASQNQVVAAHLVWRSPAGALRVLPAEAPGWKLETIWNLSLAPEAEVTTLGLGDVDGDGRPDVVAAALLNVTAPPSQLAAMSLAGVLRWSRVIPVNGLTVHNVGDFHASPGGEILVRFLRPGESEGDYYYRLIGSDGRDLCNMGWGSDLYDSALALDVDGDGRPELVLPDLRAQRFAPGLDRAGANVGAILAWKDCAVTWAQSLTGRPEDFSRHPVAADLDGDGSTEILAALRSGEVDVLRANGSLLGRVAFPTDGTGPWITGLAVADVDGSGILRVFVTTTEGKLHILSSGPEVAPQFRRVDVAPPSPPGWNRISQEPSVAILALGAASLLLVRYRRERSP